MGDMVPTADVALRSIQSALRKVEKRLEEADLRNQLMLKQGNEVADELEEELEEAEERIQVLEDALRAIAALHSPERGNVTDSTLLIAEGALASEGTPEEAS